MSHSSIPGYTIQDNSTIRMLEIPYSELKIKRKIILLTSNKLEDKMIFCNGLYQNILNFYDMFEAMGFVPLILFDDKPDPSETRDFIKHYRFVLPETVIKSELPIYALIEIGMTIQPEFRKFLKDFGTKIIKLFLGNILNIDIEISTKMPEVYFPHHINGHYNLILSSPHYNQNCSYGAAINNAPYKDSIIAPYIWNDKILKLALANESRPTTWDNSVDWHKRNIVIMEPNLGFQKCFYVPLLIAATFARNNPQWLGRIKIYNFQRILRNNNFETNIFPLLGIDKTKIELCSRLPIVDIMADNRDAIFVHHQINNEYNYMFFELMSQGFPIIHNVSSWKNYAYYYSTQAIIDKELPQALLYKVIREHKNVLSIYKGQYESLLWSHSIYNPELQRIWSELLNNSILDCVL